MATTTPTAFLVESYCPDPREEVEHLLALAARPPDGVAWPHAGVGYRGSIAVPGDELALHLFDAADAGAIESTCREVGIRCDRIVPVIPFGSVAGSPPMSVMIEGGRTDA
ncbi:MAG: hypothetical protein KF809_17960 [Chloroflexi bacterium]|nr:hypothetical protein [Chloroflexota bacterium]